MHVCTHSIHIYRHTYIHTNTLITFVSSVVYVYSSVGVRQPGI